MLGPARFILKVHCAPAFILFPNALGEPSGVLQPRLIFFPILPICFRAEAGARVAAATKAEAVAGARAAATRGVVAAEEKAGATAPMATGREVAAGGALVGATRAPAGEAAGRRRQRQQQGPAGPRLRPLRSVTLSLSSAVV